MRKILFILLLLSARAMAQMSTPPVTYVVIYPNDTIRDYWDSQRIIDYVATHGGSGFGNTTLTDDVTIDGGNLYSTYFTNMPNFIAGYKSQGQVAAFNADGDNGAYMQGSSGTYAQIEAYTDDVGGSFSHWLLDVGGVQAVLVDSGAQQGTYGYGSTNWVADNIAGTMTVNAANGIVTQGLGYLITDGSDNILSAVVNGSIFAQSTDGFSSASITTSADGSQNYFSLTNAMGEFNMALSATGTTFNMAFPPYANDAAAGIGGLTAGDLYQITGTGVVTVKQ